MTITDRLVEQLKVRGLSIRPGAEVGQLLLCGPPAEKTPEVLAAVRACKADLLERFGPVGGVAHAEQVAAVRRAVAIPDGEVCSRCRHFVFHGDEVSADDVARLCPHPDPGGCPYRAEGRG